MDTINQVDLSATESRPVQTAEPNPAANAVAAAIATVITFSVKAADMLLAGAKEAIKAAQNASLTVMDAAAECDSLAVWEASVGHAKGALAEAGMRWDDAGATYTQYVSSISAGWRQRTDIAKEVLELLAAIEERKLSVPDKLAGQVLAFVQRPEGFLIPSDARYDTVTRWRADMRLHKDLKAYMVDQAQREKAKADAAAKAVEAERVKAATDRGSIGTAQGLASGSEAGAVGTPLPERINSARLRLLNTLASLADTIDAITNPDDREEVIGAVLDVLNGADAALVQIRADANRANARPLDAEPELTATDAAILAEAVAETEAAHGAGTEADSLPMFLVPQAN